MSGFLAGFLLGAASTGLLGIWFWRGYKRKLGSYLAAAMHEVNTPITAINMTVLNFLNGVFGTLADENLRWMEMLRTQCSRLGGMVGEFRDIIHLELKEDLVLRNEPTSLPEAVEQVMENLRRGIPAAELMLELDVPGDLPPVSADAERLSRSILSMVFHARKFRISGAIRLTARTVTDRAEVAVSYLGPKMTPVEAEKSLDLYYPAMRRKDQILCAVGMGLGTLRELVRLQGGDLGLSVEREGQTTLKLIFPLAK